jgi:hypothetical protein
MGGSITKTASGYALQIGITKSTDKMTMASWSGTCTFAELDDLSGIRRASLDLLGKMGVTLTEKAAAELSGAVDRKQAKAQTALARGITAQKSGNAAASLAFYYQANQYDPRLKEATVRVNQLSASVRTGSLGEDIRNDIAWREQWIKLYGEAYAYIVAHPEALVEFKYSPVLKQGKVDYEKREVTFSARAGWNKTEEPSSWKMLADLDKGLKATRRQRAWGIITGWNSSLVQGDEWSHDYLRQIENWLEKTWEMYYFPRLKMYYHMYSPPGERDQKSAERLSRYLWMRDDLPRLGYLYDGRMLGSMEIIYSEYKEHWKNENLRMWTGRYDLFDRTYYLTAYLYNDQGRHVGTDNITCSTGINDGSRYIRGDDTMEFVVSADDITDNMTIKIEDIEEFGRKKAFMRSGPDIIPISVMR